MITIMKIMLKIKKIKNIFKKIKSPCEWSFLTIIITITTNKTLIADKTLTGEEKKNKQYYLFITSKLWKDYFV